MKFINNKVGNALDLMITNDGQGTVTLLENNGDGSFKAPKHFGFNVFDAPQPPVWGDLNQDGAMDVAVPLNNSGKIAVMFGDGLGNFTTSYLSTNLTGIGPIVTMDFNGDFHPDLLVVGANGTAVVFLGNGKGNFVNGGSFATGGNNVASVAAADYNRDGNFDVAFAGYSDSQVRVFQGLGNGKFDVNNPKIINVGNHPLSLINIYRVRNGAVASDLAIANNGSGTISVIASSCSQ